MNYIDLHTHILPGLDDGPRTMRESILLARALVAAGFATVVATPHSVEGRPAPALILERQAELQAELTRREIPLQVLPGAEPHIDPHLDQRLRKGETLTLNHSSYLYVELPFSQPLPAYTGELFFKLSVEGYRPIIPHPERAEALLKEPAQLQRLHSAGALYQVTWAAFTGRLGPAAEKLARHLLAEKLLHLLATDAHKPGVRLGELRKAADAVDELCGRGTAHTYLADRPAAVIADRTLDLPPAAAPPAEKKKFFLFSRFHRR